MNLIKYLAKKTTPVLSGTRKAHVYSKAGKGFGRRFASRGAGDDRHLRPIG